MTFASKQSWGIKYLTSVRKKANKTASVLGLFKISREEASLAYPLSPLGKRALRNSRLEPCQLHIPATPAVGTKTGITSSRPA